MQPIPGLVILYLVLETNRAPPMYITLSFLDAMLYSFTEDSLGRQNC